MSKEKFENKYLVAYEETHRSNWEMKCSFQIMGRVDVRCNYTGPMGGDGGHGGYLGIEMKEDCYPNTFPNFKIEARGDMETRTMRDALMKIVEFMDKVNNEKESIS